jgi:hypothetical protein
MREMKRERERERERKREREKERKRKRKRKRERKKEREREVTYYEEVELGTRKHPQVALWFRISFFFLVST